MDAGDAVDVRRDVVEHGRRVPEVPGVELEPERRAAARVCDQLEGGGDRARDRPLLAAVRLVGLEREPRPGEVGLGRERAQCADDDLTSRIGIEACSRPGQADDAGGAERGQPVDRGADRVDPLLRILGPPSSGSGRGDGIAGTADAASSPLDSNASSTAPSFPSSGSFSSQIPTPSRPAPAYAARSSSKLAGNVEICEMEKRGPGRRFRRAIFPQWSGPPGGAAAEPLQDRSATREP